MTQTKNPATNIQSMYQHMREMLSPEHGEGAALEARLLTQHALGLSVESFFLKWDQLIDETEQQACLKVLKRRLDHEPFSRITQTREFWGHSFQVTPATLDPRPDSETLIEAVLDVYPLQASPYHFLDLGTGTGCLLITLLKAYPHAQGWAVDLSPEAMEVALFNAHRHKVSERFYPMCGSWENVKKENLSPDIIICNPPYIPHAHIATLAPAVRDYDPHLALDGGIDGLDAYRTLEPLLKTLCRPHASVFLEIGHDQKESVLNIFAPPAWKKHDARCDLSGHDRVVVFQKNPL